MKGFHAIKGSALVLASALALGACDGDPVGATEDHPDAVGLVVTRAGVDVVTVTGLNIVGALTVGEGEESPRYEVVLIDENGNRFTPDDEDEWLKVTIANPAAATWTQDAPGEFGGRLRGLVAGTTTIGFDLMHGPVGAASSHRDFGTPNIPLIVN